MSVSNKATQYTARIDWVCEWGVPRLSQITVIFSVYQIITSGGKVHIFWQRHGQKYHSKFSKTPFEVKSSFCEGLGPPKTIPVVGGVTPPHIPYLAPNQAFWDPSLRPCQNSRLFWWWCLCFWLPSEIWSTVVPEKSR